MASPFSIFRKHQRVMMAVLGVAAMIAFVFLGPAEQLLSLRGGQDPLVATSVYGTIHQSDLEHMHAMRIMANRFMAEAVKAAGGQQRTDAFGAASESSLVETMLLANKAEESGVIISDQFITDWLKRNLMDRVTAQQYEGIVRQLGVSKLQVYEALRTELLALQSVEMFFPGVQQGQSLAQECAIFTLYNSTPAQRWEYFQRLRREATVEVLPVNVADFIGEIANPSESVIASFFEEHKETEPRPGSPEPGFKIPQKEKLQYFVAERDKFVDPASVTEEQINKHYEENKENEYLFRQWPRYAPVEKPLEPPAAKPEEKPSAEKPDSSEKAPDNKPDDTKPADAQPDAAKSDAEKPAAPTPKAEGAAPASSPKSDAPKSETPKSEPPKAETPKADGAAVRRSQDSHAAAAPTVALAVPRYLPLVSPGLTSINAALETALLFSAAQEKSEKAPSKDSAEATKSAAEKPDAAKSGAAKPPATPAATEKKTEEKPATAKADSEKSAADQPAGKSNAETPAATPRPLGPPTALPTVEPPDAFLPQEPFPTVPKDAILPREITDYPTYLPLSYVVESIREELARQRADEKMIETLDAVSATMKRYGDERRRWELRHQDNPSATPPQPLDLKAIAKENNLSLHETALLTAHEAQLLPGIGNSRAEAEYGLGPFFVYVLFGNLQLFQPVQTFDNPRNGYLFWKTESNEARVPELAAVRDEVVRAWKMIQARERAMKRAESLADQARKDNRPLKAILGDRAGMQVVETPPFPWMTEDTTSGLAGQSVPTLSEVQGVVDAGNDFMRTVFNLHVGDVGAAFNNPQTIAYVIRVNGYEPSLTVLHERFLATPLPLYSAAAAFDRQKMIVAWNQAVLKEAKLEWERPPIPGRGER